MSAWSLLSNLTVFQSYYCSMYLLLQDYVQSIYEAEFFFRDLPEIPGAIEAAQEINKMEEYVYHGKTSLFFLCLCFLTHYWLSVMKIVFIIVAFHEISFMNTQHHVNFKVWEFTCSARYMCIF